MNDSMVAETRAGLLRGFAVGETRAFLGIGYAEPPLGPLRFRSPRTIAPWHGIRDAVRLGSPAMQHCVDPPNWVDPLPPSEDCLYLNVWAPMRGDAVPKPVMVWVHGGGFMSGSGGLPTYDGRNLAELGDVVVVTINHRLNVFGYLWLGDLDPRYADHANCGQQDLVAALEWIRDNIAAFGGDPDNVTLFGESGGGAKISALLATPAASGLFHKAIVQSGSQPAIQDRARATDVARHGLAAAGIDPGDVARLETLPAATLVAVSDAVQARFGILCFQPVVDRRVIPRQTWESAAPPESAGIPMIIGTNSHEGITFLSRKDRQPASDDEMRDWFAGSLGAPPLSQAEWTIFLASYRRVMPDASGLELLVAMLTDVWMWQGALHQAELKIAQGDAPVFLYELGWRTPAFGGAWAVHAIDLPFVFGNLTYGTAWDGADDDRSRVAADPAGDRFRLADRIMRCWAAFAHRGDPSIDEIAWPAYDLETRATLHFDRNVEVRNDPNAARRALVAGLPFGW